MKSKTKIILFLTFLIFLIFLIFLMIWFVFYLKKKRKTEDYGVIDTIANLNASITNMSGVDRITLLNYSSVYSNYLDAIQNFAGNSTYNTTLGTFICPTSLPYASITGGKIQCSATTTLPYDCITGTWGSCVNNTQTRVGDIPSLNGGIPCDSSTRVCSNCILSVTNTGCVNGLNTTTVKVLSSAYNGGTCSFSGNVLQNTTGFVMNITSLCPVDCVMSAWSGYGTCSASCGGGTQTRTRTVQTAAINGGTCPVNNVVGTVQTDTPIACNTQTCAPNLDCVYSEWSSPNCATGMRTRTITSTRTQGCKKISKPLTDDEMAACPNPKFWRGYYFNSPHDGLWDGTLLGQIDGTTEAACIQAVQNNPNAAYAQIFYNDPYDPTKGVGRCNIWTASLNSPTVDSYKSPMDGPNTIQVVEVKAGKSLPVKTNPPCAYGDWTPCSCLTYNKQRTSTQGWCNDTKDSCNPVGCNVQIKTFKLVSGLSGSYYGSGNQILNRFDNNINTGIQTIGINGMLAGFTFTGTGNDQNWGNICGAVYINLVAPDGKEQTIGSNTVPRSGSPVSFTFSSNDLYINITSDYKIKLIAGGWWPGCAAYVTSGTIELKIQ